MNRNGFTLIELLAVIVVIGLIMLIAVPNIVGLSTGVRKDMMLDDAKKLISLAKNKVNTDADIRAFTKASICNGTSSCTLSFEMLNVNGDIEKDPDGGSYMTGSQVIYRTVSGTVDYCVTLIGSKRTIGVPTCVKESELYSRSKVQDK